MDKRDKKGIGLLPGKRGPKQPALKTPEALEQIVCEALKTESPSSERLKANHPEFPSARTIRRIAKRNGLKQKPAKKEIGFIQYEHSNPGDLAHIDLKKLPNVRGENPKEKQYLAGMEDDHTRIVYQEKLPNKQVQTLSDFFERALTKNTVSALSDCLVITEPSLLLHTKTHVTSMLLSKLWFVTAYGTSTPSHTDLKPMER